MVDPAEERRRRPVPGRHWEESYSFDFAVADASLGGYVRLGLRPAEGVAWFWAALAEPGRPTVLVRDHDVELPPGRSLEVRASGLWADMTCETPLEHWTIGLESFGVALDDPADAFGDERGEPRSLGFDLEWEATAAAGTAWAQAEAGYGQSCEVHGEVLVGSRRIDVAAVGWRAHEWGPRDWSAGPSSWVTGHLDGGPPFAGRCTATAVGDDGLVTSATAMLPGGGDVELAPVAHAPVAIAGAGTRLARLDRALCHCRATSGRAGVGWTEQLQSP